MAERITTTNSLSIFNIPKINKKSYKGNIQPVDLQNRDVQHLLRDINKNCLDINFSKGIDVLQVSLVHNADLLSRYIKKRAEMKDAGRGNQFLNDQLGFLVTNSAKKWKIAKEGLCTRPSQFNRLGKGECGVYLTRFFDIEVKCTLRSEETVEIFVFKYFSGKCKPIVGKIFGKQPDIEPTPNYDSHVSHTMPTLTDHILTQVARSYIYLYEYTEECVPSKFPRHCLPFAIIKLRRKQLEKPIRRANIPCDTPLPLPLPDKSGSKRPATTTTHKTSAESSRSSSKTVQVSSPESNVKHSVVNTNGQHVSGLQRQSLATEAANSITKQNKVNLCDVKDKTGTKPSHDSLKDQKVKLSAAPNKTALTELQNQYLKRFAAASEKIQAEKSPMIDCLTLIPQTQAVLPRNYSEFCVENQTRLNAPKTKLFDSELSLSVSDGHKAELHINNMGNKINVGQKHISHADPRYTSWQKQSVNSSGSLASSNSRSNSPGNSASKCTYPWSVSASETVHSVNQKPVQNIHLSSLRNDPRLRKRMQSSTASNPVASVTVSRNMPNSFNSTVKVGNTPHHRPSLKKVDSHSNIKNKISLSEYKKLRMKGQALDSVPIGVDTNKTIAQEEMVTNSTHCSKKIPEVSVRNQTSAKPAYKPLSTFEIMGSESPVHVKDGHSAEVSSPKKVTSLQKPIQAELLPPPVIGSNDTVYAMIRGMVDDTIKETKLSHAVTSNENYFVATKYNFSISSKNKCIHPKENISTHKLQQEMKTLQKPQLRASRNSASHINVIINQRERKVTGQGIEDSTSVIKVGQLAECTLQLTPNPDSDGIIHVTRVDSDNYCNTGIDYHQPNQESISTSQKHNSTQSSDLTASSVGCVAEVNCHKTVNGEIKDNNKPLASHFAPIHPSTSIVDTSTVLTPAAMKYDTVLSEEVQHSVLTPTAFRHDIVLTEKNQHIQSSDFGQSSYTTQQIQPIREKPLPKSISMRDIGLESYVLALYDMRYQPFTVVVDYKQANYKKNCHICMASQQSIAFHKKKNPYNQVNNKKDCCICRAIQKNDTFKKNKRILHSKRLKNSNASSPVDVTATSADKEDLCKTVINKHSTVSWTQIENTYNNVDIILIEDSPPSASSADAEFEAALKWSPRLFSDQYKEDAATEVENKFSETVPSYISRSQSLLNTKLGRIACLNESDTTLAKKSIFLNSVSSINQEKTPIINDGITIQESAVTSFEDITSKTEGVICNLNIPSTECARDEKCCLSDTAYIAQTAVHKTSTPQADFSGKDINIDTSHDICVLSTTECSRDRKLNLNVPKDSAEIAQKASIKTSTLQVNVCESNILVDDDTFRECLLEKTYRQTQANVKNVESNNLQKQLACKLKRFKEVISSQRNKEMADVREEKILAAEKQMSSKNPEVMNSMPNRSRRITYRNISKLRSNSPDVFRLEKKVFPFQSKKNNKMQSRKKLSQPSLRTESGTSPQIKYWKLEPLASVATDQEHSARYERKRQKNNLLVEKNDKKAVLTAQGNCISNLEQNSPSAGEQKDSLVASGSSVEDENPVYLVTLMEDSSKHLSLPRLDLQLNSETESLQQTFHNTASPGAIPENSPVSCDQVLSSKAVTVQPSQLATEKFVLDADLAHCLATQQQETSIISDEALKRDKMEAVGMSNLTQCALDETLLKHQRDLSVGGVVDKKNTTDENFDEINDTKSNAEEITDAIDSEKNNTEVSFDVILDRKSIADDNLDRIADKKSIAEENMVVFDDDKNKAETSSDVIYNGNSLAEGNMVVIDDDKNKAETSSDVIDDGNRQAEENMVVIDNDKNKAEASSDGIDDGNSLAEESFNEKSLPEENSDVIVAKKIAEDNLDGILAKKSIAEESFDLKDDGKRKADESFDEKSIVKENSDVITVKKSIAEMNLDMLVAKKSIEKESFDVIDDEKNKAQESIEKESLEVISIDQNSTEVNVDVIVDDSVIKKENSVPAANINNTSMEDESQKMKPNQNSFSLKLFLDKVKKSTDVKKHFEKEFLTFQKEIDLLDADSEQDSHCESLQQGVAISQCDDSLQQGIATSQCKYLQQGLASSQCKYLQQGVATSQNLMLPNNTRNILFTDFPHSVAIQHIDNICNAQNQTASSIMTNAKRNLREVSFENSEENLDIKVTRPAVHTSDMNSLYTPAQMGNHAFDKGNKFLHDMQKILPLDSVSGKVDQLDLAVNRNTDLQQSNGDVNFRANSLTSHSPLMHNWNYSYQNHSQNHAMPGGNILLHGDESQTNLYTHQNCPQQLFAQTPVTSLLHTPSLNMFGDQAYRQLPHAVSILSPSHAIIPSNDIIRTDSYESTSPMQYYTTAEQYRLLAGNGSSFPNYNDLPNKQKESGSAYNKSSFWMSSSSCVESNISGLGFATSDPKSSGIPGLDNQSHNDSEQNGHVSYRSIASSAAGISQSVAEAGKKPQEAQVFDPKLIYPEIYNSPRITHNNSHKEKCRDILKSLNSNFSEEAKTSEINTCRIVEDYSDDEQTDMALQASQSKQNSQSSLTKNLADFTSTDEEQSSRLADLLFEHLSKTIQKVDSTAKMEHDTNSNLKVLLRLKEILAKGKSEVSETPFEVKTQMENITPLKDNISRPGTSVSEELDLNGSTKLCGSHKDAEVDAHSCADPCLVTSSDIQTTLNLTDRSNSPSALKINKNNIGISDLKSPEQGKKASSSRSRSKNRNEIITSNSPSSVTNYSSIALKKQIPSHKISSDDCCRLTNSKSGSPVSGYKSASSDTLCEREKVSAAYRKRKYSSSRSKLRSPCSSASEQSSPSPRQSSSNSSKDRKGNFLPKRRRSNTSRTHDSSPVNPIKCASPGLNTVTGMSAEKIHISTTLSDRSENYLDTKIQDTFCGGDENDSVISDKAKSVENQTNTSSASSSYHLSDSYMLSASSTTINASDDGKVYLRDVPLSALSFAREKILGEINKLGENIYIDLTDESHIEDSFTQEKTSADTKIPGEINKLGENIYIDLTDESHIEDSFTQEKTSADTKIPGYFLDSVKHRSNRVVTSEHGELEDGELPDSSGEDEFTAGFKKIKFKKFLSKKCRQINHKSSKEKVVKRSGHILETCNDKHEQDLDDSLTNISPVDGSSGVLCGKNKAVACSQAISETAVSERVIQKKTSDEVKNCKLKVSLDSATDKDTISGNDSNCDKDGRLSVSVTEACLKKVSIVKNPNNLSQTSSKLDVEEQEHIEASGKIKTCLFPGGDSDVHFLNKEILLSEGDSGINKIKSRNDSMLLKELKRKMCSPFKNMQPDVDNLSKESKISQSKKSTAEISGKNSEKNDALLGTSKKNSSLMLVTETCNVDHKAADKTPAALNLSLKNDNSFSVTCDNSALAKNKNTYNSPEKTLKPAKLKIHFLKSKNKTLSEIPGALNLAVNTVHQNALFCSKSTKTVLSTQGKNCLQNVKVKAKEGKQTRVTSKNTLDRQCGKINEQINEDIDGEQIKVEQIEVNNCNEVENKSDGHSSSFIKLEGSDSVKATKRSNKDRFDSSAMETKSKTASYSNRGARKESCSPQTRDSKRRRTGSRNDTSSYLGFRRRHSRSTHSPRKCSRKSKRHFSRSSSYSRDRSLSIYSRDRSLSSYSRDRSLSYYSRDMSLSSYSRDRSLSAYSRYSRSSSLMSRGSRSRHRSRSYMRNRRSSSFSSSSHHRRRYSRSSSSSRQYRHRRRSPAFRRSERCRSYRRSVHSSRSHYDSSTSESRCRYLSKSPHKYNRSNSCSRQKKCSELDYYSSRTKKDQLSKMPQTSGISKSRTQHPIDMFYNVANMSTQKNRESSASMSYRQDKVETIEHNFVPKVDAFTGYAVSHQHIFVQPVSTHAEYSRKDVTVYQLIISQLGISFVNEFKHTLPYSLNAVLNSPIFSQQERSSKALETILSCVRYLNIPDVLVLNSNIEPVVNNYGNLPFEQRLEHFTDEQILLEVNVIKHCQNILEQQQTHANQRLQQLTQKKIALLAKINQAKSLEKMNPDSVSAEMLSTFQLQLVAVIEEEGHLNEMIGTFSGEVLPKELQVPLKGFSFITPAKPMSEDDALKLKTSLEAAAVSILELYKCTNFGREHFRVPELLLLEEEKQYLYSRGNCFLVLNKSIPKKVFVRLLTLKKKIELLELDDKKSAAERHFITKQLIEERSSVLLCHVGHITSKRVSKMRTLYNQLLDCKDYMRNVIGSEGVRKLQLFDTYISAVQHHWYLLSNEDRHPSFPEYSD